MQFSVILQQKLLADARAKQNLLNNNSRTPNLRSVSMNAVADRDQDKQARNETSASNLISSTKIQNISATLPNNVNENNLVSFTFYFENNSLKNEI